MFEICGRVVNLYESPPSVQEEEELKEMCLIALERRISEEERCSTSIKIEVEEASISLEHEKEECTTPMNVEVLTQEGIQILVIKSEEHIVCCIMKKGTTRVDVLPLEREKSK